MSTAAAIGALAAAIVSAMAIPLLVSLVARQYLVDHPNVRSSHRIPRARGGGLAILFGLCAGILVAALLGLHLTRTSLTLLIAALALGLIGLWDDMKHLPVLPRLLFQIVVACGVVLVVGSVPRIPLPPPLDVPLGVLAAPLTILWLVAVTNFFNFMDGIDGLAGGQAIATCTAVILAGWGTDAIAVAAILLGAAAGFLAFNWPPARIFLGDVGSLPVGFLLAALPLLAPPERRPYALLATAISLSLFLLDPAVTLLRLFRRKRRLGQPHREHAYQRLLLPGKTHRPVTGALVLTGFALSTFGAWAYRVQWAWWPAIALAVLSYAIEHRLAARAEMRRGASAASGAGQETPAIPLGSENEPAPDDPLLEASWTPYGVINSSRALRYGIIVLIDAAFTAACLYLAFLLRFDGEIPPEHVVKLVAALPILVIVRVAASIVFGLHRWSFRMSGFYEAVRLVSATASGTLCFVALFYFYQRVGPPRSVILLEFFLTSAAMAALRFSPRLASGWFVDQRRSRSEGSIRTIVIGAGSGGDLLLRDLSRSREHQYHVVGFVDDDPKKIGTYLGGRPVLGNIGDLPRLVEEQDVTQVLIAIPRLSSERIQTILRLCSRLKVHFKIIPVSFTYVNELVNASMLHDLSPEDLLARDATAFDTREIQTLITGRRVLVTGAGGSIGGELARQISTYGPASLVLVDINENGLYFLYRELRETRPDLKVYAEVADIREESRLDRLAALHRPQYVFHAAAHKHVPLLEDAPEEAVKNNVFGTQNVARMADRYGAERFVLISTDKAVHPSSVMGATKRVAEFVVRDMARKSSTRFTAVRFGNVLGSSGSVVPLFKQQIERGGPVSVTHPECRRYFMTIPEAVGLVLLSGLGDYGELCILDMGQPIKIVDLASHMITMAGYIPGVDIKIEFTGLRPGEKLYEEIMTEEEEESHVVRDRVYAATAPDPPLQLAEHLDDLHRAADRGDRDSIFRILESLIPTFQPFQQPQPSQPAAPPLAIGVGPTH